MLICIVPFFRQVLFSESTLSWLDVRTGSDVIGMDLFRSIIEDLGPEAMASIDKILGLKAKKILQVQHSPNRKKTHALPTVLC